MDSGSSRREVGGDTAFGDPLEFEAAGEGLEKGGLNVGAPRKKHLKLDLEPLSCVSMGTIIEEVFSDGVIKTIRSYENRQSAYEHSFVCGC